MSKLLLRIFDGSRELFSAAANFLVTITDGNPDLGRRMFSSTRFLMMAMSAGLRCDGGIRGSERVSKCRNRIRAARTKAHVVSASLVPFFKGRIGTDDVFDPTDALLNVATLP
jgi:hypothetical protein